MNPPSKHYGSVRGMNSPRLSQVFAAILIVTCMLLMGSRAPEPSLRHTSSPKPPIDVHVQPFPNGEVEERAAAVDTKSLGLPQYSVDTVAHHAPTPAVQRKTASAIKVKKWHLALATLAYLLGLGLFASSAKRPKKNRKTQAIRLKSSLWKIIRNRVLIGLMITTAIGGGTLLAMLIYGIVLTAFPLALLATFATLIVAAGVGFIIFKIKEDDFNRHAGNPAQAFANGCAAGIFILFVLIPVTIVLGGLTMGLFLPLFCGVSFHFGAAILSWLCLAAPCLGAYAGSLALLEEE